MKERELLQHMTCDSCQKQIIETGLPLFWTATLTRYGLEADAIRRRQGLSIMMGSNPLAAALGPDEDLAVELAPPVKVTICETCATEGTTPLCHLALMKLEERSYDDV